MRLASLPADCHSLKAICDRAGRGKPHKFAFSLNYGPVNFGNDDYDFFVEQSSFDFDKFITEKNKCVVSICTRTDTDYSSSQVYSPSGNVSLTEDFLHGLNRVNVCAVYQLYTCGVQ